MIVKVRGILLRYALVDIDPGPATSWDDVLVLARLDYTQNAVNKTLVAPYSPRGSGRPVSAPIEWEELDDPSLRPRSFTIRDVARRLAERGDVFQTVLTAQQVLPPIT